MILHASCNMPINTFACHFIPTSLYLCHVRKIHEDVQKYSDKHEHLEAYFKRMKETVVEIDVLFTYENSFVDGYLSFQEDNFNVRFRERSLITTLCLLCAVIGENLRGLKIPSFQHVVEQDKLYSSIATHCSNLEEFHQSFHPNDFKGRFQYSLTGFQHLKTLRLCSPDSHVMSMLAVSPIFIEELRLHRLGADALKLVPNVIREKGSRLKKLCVESESGKNSDTGLQEHEQTLKSIANRCISFLVEFSKYLFYLVELRLILSSVSINSTNALIRNLLEKYKGRTDIEIGCDDFAVVKKFSRGEPENYYLTQLSPFSLFVKEIGNNPKRLQQLKKLDFGDWNCIHHSSDVFLLQKIKQSSEIDVKHINMGKFPGLACDQKQFYEVMDGILNLNHGDLTITCNCNIIRFLVEMMFQGTEKWDLLAPQLAKINKLNLMGISHCSSVDRCNECILGFNELVRSMPVFLSEILPMMFSIRAVTLADPIVIQNVSNSIYLQNLWQTLQFIDQLKKDFEKVDLSIIRTQFQLLLEESESPRL